MEKAKKNKEMKGKSSSIAGNESTGAKRSMVGDDSSNRKRSTVGRETRSEKPSAAGDESSSRSRSVPNWEAGDRSEQPGIESKRLEYLERMGIFFEREGLPRMAGRIFAFLLSDKQDAVSTSAILEALHASRGSVSTMTRFLMERGMVEKTGKRGERQDYFRIKRKALNTMFSNRLDIVHEFKAIMVDGLSFTEPESENHRMAEELAAFYDWFEKRMPALWKEWEEEKKRRKL